MLTARAIAFCSSATPAFSPVLALASAPPPPPSPPPPRNNLYFWLMLLAIAAVVFVFFAPDLFAQARLPGSDESSKLEAAGTLLRLVDTMLFTWGARLFAGLCILSAGWNLKEQRYALMVLSVVGAVVIGSAPFWVKNIFDIGGGSSIFSQIGTVNGWLHV